jgi:hypothetical protein
VDRHLGRGYRETQAGEPAQKTRERNLNAQTDQVLPQTHMAANSEREMSSRVAKRIEPVRVDELRRIAVRGRERHADSLARVDPNALQVDLLERGPRRDRLEDREISQELVDRSREQGAVVTERVPPLPVND